MTISQHSAISAAAEQGELHLLTAPAVRNLVTSFPQPGDNLVAKGYPKYVPAQNNKPGRIQINKDQYFDDVPQTVWDFHIGGYQVLDKWLKDRRGRQLSYQDLTHYQQVIVALLQTIDLMTEIDTFVHFPSQQSDVKKLL